MARELTKSLSEAQIREAKVREKLYYLRDGDGLYVKIFPSGVKSWRLDYYSNKSRTTITIGHYPAMSLKEARIKKNQLKEMIYNSNGKINLSEALNPETFTENIFTIEDLTEKYFKKREDLSKAYIEDTIQKFNKNIYPYLGKFDIKNLTTLQILKPLQDMDTRGANISAKKTFGSLMRVFSFGLANGLIANNPMAGLNKRLIFRSVKKENFAHTTDLKELKIILNSIDRYDGDYLTRTALQILPYVFVRPYNIRHMRWSDIDFENDLWKIPAEDMKMKKELIVPLCSFVVARLQEVRKMYGDRSKYVFFGILTTTKPMSENTMNSAYKRMGFDITSHGFRHTASTLLHENFEVHGFRSDVIEMQLAHKIGSSVHQVYNKALYIGERKKLMIWWGEFLDNLKR